MAVQLNKDIEDLLSDEETVKVLATTDKKGVPHAVVKQTLHLGEDGNLVYLELLESSRTNKNMVGSIWFDRKVSIVLTGKNGLSYQIIGAPIKGIITGNEFQKYYADIRQKLGDVDLSTVWIIKPEEVFNQTFSVRRHQEESKRPLFTHLDRLSKHASAS